ncbi:MAG: regulatory iron-sulfur-containing complex subunit RicT, partial [Bacilli bacterium]
MVRVVGIGFKEVGKIYWFNPDPFKLNINDHVIVETIRGLELGKVVEPIKEIDESSLEHELKKVIRLATKKDIEINLVNEKKAEEAIPLIKAIISSRELDMKIVGSEYTLDASKLIIYYNAEGRVDFRELVKDLAAEFKIRIELRQIGQREGAKMIGAIGTCGREVCCKKHLREFDLVTMKMAKDQGM